MSWTMMSATDGLGKQLQAARKAAKARADAAPKPEQEAPGERSVEECVVLLVIAMFSTGLKMGMGIMPDGMAMWVRLSMPSTTTDDRAGMVSFCVSDDTQAVLNKAVDALETTAKSSYWRPDRFSKGQDTQ